MPVAKDRRAPCRTLTYWTAVRSSKHTIYIEYAERVHSASLLRVSTKFCLMKILITGATGTIGGAILSQQFLSHPSITSIIALSRRPLKRSSPKLQTIIVKDLETWDDELLSQIIEADAMVWCVGTNDAHPDNLRLPQTFQETFLRARTKAGISKRFRYIQTSGALVEPDQSKNLWFMSDARKFKGIIETKFLDFAEENKAVWQTYIIKPGGPLEGKWWDWIAKAVLGDRMAIKTDELAAFVANLVVTSEEKEARISNRRMVEVGQMLLESQKHD